MMNFDFELVLVVLTLLAGVVLLIDKLGWQKARLKKLQQSLQVANNTQADVEVREHKLPILLEYSRSFFPVLVIVVILRSFLYEPYQIPSGSMLPTLEIGDFIVVNKYTYGVRLPVTGTKVVTINNPQRGDVVVFKYPRNPAIKYIKRVVGVPGDKLMYKNKHLYINGEPVIKESLGTDISQHAHFRETIDGQSHEIWQKPSVGRDWESTQVLGEGQYFVMGDNRDSSNDSRIWGTVDDSLIVGKAEYIWMQWKTFFSVPNFSTVGSIE